MVGGDVGDDLEARIDDLYALPLDRFTPERDALAGELKAAGAAEDAKRVKALRKPVVSAWAVNALAREDPAGIAELAALGRRLRDAQRQALSGGDAEPLRAALENRRALVGRLSTAALAVLEREGAGGSSQTDEIAATLDAAAVDEEAAAAVAAGRLVRPMRPPAAFGDAPALTVLPGGRRPSAEPAEPAEDARGAAKRAAELRRELASAETREKRARDAVERARGKVEEAERRRADLRERLREAEAELRGASLEAKRAAAALSKLEPKPKR
jgi:hypothetical protein